VLRPPTSDGLVTNELAYFNPDDSSAPRSRDWEMTSGSLFSLAGRFWTGRPDAIEPDPNSASSTNSAVFRLTTRRHDFQDVEVDLTLNNRRLVTTPSTPAVNWDGVHIFLRYQDQYNLYYASVARRDGHVVLKKKCRGGPDNGGTYYELGRGEVAGHPFTPGQDMRVGARVENGPDGSVHLALLRGGATILSAVDTGVGCAPIRAAGAVGLRGDNDDFTFADFRIRPL